MRSSLKVKIWSWAEAPNTALSIPWSICQRPVMDAGVVGGSVLNFEEGSNTQFFICNETFNCFTTTPHEPLLYLAYSSARCRFSALKQNLKWKLCEGRFTACVTTGSGSEGLKNWSQSAQIFKFCFSPSVNSIRLRTASVLSCLLQLNLDNL